MEGHDAPLPASVRKGFASGSLVTKSLSLREYEMKTSAMNPQSLESIFAPARIPMKCAKSESTDAVISEQGKQAHSSRL